MGKKIGRNRTNPENYPEFSKREYPVTTRKALGNQVQFVSFRSFSRDAEGVAHHFRQEMDLYVEQLAFGRVLWINSDLFKIQNYREIIDEIKRRGLYLFDIWGYVPGSFHPDLSWGQVMPTPEQDAYIKSTLGELFLGYDNGEQDGRYIGTYAEALCPALPDRKRQYMRFQKHFETLCDHMGNLTTALCSLNYGHYFLKEQNAVMLGAETAQALPNANLWYAYLRGAGKQYGVLWFGNASVFNRYAWKAYDTPGATEGHYTCGPDVGTSLSLLRRLLYQEYLYNSDILGYESAITMKGSNGNPIPSPIGEIQHGLMRLSEQYGYPGEMHVPAAVMLDFYNGWTFPRHLYTGETYKVWGNIPYDAGDHQTHALFSMMYPGYEDAGFYLDERGFMTPTPHGDIADVVFSVIRSDILDNYGTLILSGGFTLDYELYQKLRLFVHGGGRLLLFAGQLESGNLEATAPGYREFFGIKSTGPVKTAGSCTVLFSDGAVVPEAKEFCYFALTPVPEAETVAQFMDGSPLILKTRRGEGEAVLVAAPFGLVSDPNPEPFSNKPETPLPMTYDLAYSVKKAVADLLKQERIVGVSQPELGYSVNITGSNSVLLAVTNNTNRDFCFDILPVRSEISGISEITLHDVPKNTVGYYPKDYVPGTSAGSGAYGIPAGDIRLYAVTLRDALPPLRDEIIPADTASGYALAIHALNSGMSFTLSPKPITRS